jgi:hypothetical protein
VQRFFFFWLCFLFFSGTLSSQHSPENLMQETRTYELITAAWDELTNQHGGSMVGDDALTRDQIAHAMFVLAQQMRKPFGWTVRAPEGTWSMTTSEEIMRDARAHGWAVQELYAVDQKD